MHHRGFTQTVIPERLTSFTMCMTVVSPSRKPGSSIRGAIGRGRALRSQLGQELNDVMDPGVVCLSDSDRQCTIAPLHYASADCDRSELVLTQLCARPCARGDLTRLTCLTHMPREAVAALRFQRSLCGVIPTLFQPDR